MVSHKWLLITASLAFFVAGCGEEYYSTPEKTLEHYVRNRTMRTREQYESCLNAFRREDREWFEKHYMKLCTAMYGRDCPGESLATEVTVWTDAFEPAGPASSTVESSEIDDKNGTAVLVVEGQEVEFVKSNGNWKINGFFGVVEKLEEKYPQIQDPA